MKEKMLKVSLFLGLLLCMNQTAYASTDLFTLSQVNVLFDHVYELVNQAVATINEDLTTRLTKTGEQQDVTDPLVGQIATQDEFGEREVPKGEELPTNIEEAIEPVYVDQVDIPLNPSEVEEVVSNMNNEMIEIEDEIKQQAIEAAEKEAQIPVFENYRQTFYAVTNGEVKVGYGLTYQDNGIKNIDNVMHYYDEEYEWLPVVAVDIDEVLASGLDKRGVPNYYGTVLEIEYPNGVCQNAVVLDACGACSWDERIDLWLYSPDHKLDVEGIKYKVIRNGF